MITIDPDVNWGVTGVAATLYYRVLNAANGVVIARANTGVEESPAGSMIYHVANGISVDPAVLQRIVWDDGTYYASESLAGYIGTGTSTLTQTQVTGYAGPILTDNTTGLVSSNLVSIMGSALTGTAALIRAAFVKWFNVATPTGTVNSIPDAVAGATNGLAIVGSEMATPADMATATNQATMATAIAAVPAGILTTPANKLATDATGKVTTSNPSAAITKITVTEGGQVSVE